MTDSKTVTKLLIAKLIHDIRMLDYEVDRHGSDMTLGDYEQAESDLLDEYAQAIAATLESGECEWMLEHSGSLYDKWRCSSCGFQFVEPRCDQGYMDLEPNYCPNCGKVVKR